MEDRQTYEFAVIRFVPRVEREEFFNLGVILFSKRKNYLGLKYKVDKNKLAAFSSEVDVAFLERYLKAWEDVCAGYPKGGSMGKMEAASRFRWLTASRSTIIQSSETHPGLCSDPEKTLEELFTLYVD
jgi:hypothetical protein